MSKPPLLIRADASAEMGTGHVMRTLALAQAWTRERGAAHYACVSMPEGLKARLEGEGITVHLLDSPADSVLDAQGTRELAARLGAPWIVLDGYQFSAPYHHAIRAEGHRLLLLDDHGHASHYEADLLLNSNPLATEEFYRDRTPETKLLLGAKYLLLRQEFLTARTPRQAAARAGKILVTLGGSDPANETLRVVEALQSVSCHAKIIVGPANPHLKSLKEAAARIAAASGSRLEILSSISDMPPLMAWADLAISAAGGTAWELAYLGVPMLLLSIAENQLRNARFLTQAGAALDLGPSDALKPALLARELSALAGDAPRRGEMIRSGQDLVDGKGVSRVMELLV